MAECNPELLTTIRESVIGEGTPFVGPFGKRKMVYADYVASGKSLTFIEDYIRDFVLPHYGNTHTTVSTTGHQTTFFRREARETIQQCVNATEEDQVLFIGSGVTAALHSLCHGLQLAQYCDHPEGPAVVFVSPFEHHSNLLAWRESGAEVVIIAEDEQGNINLNQLEYQLTKYFKRPLLVGSFAAASNVTGIIVDVDAIAVLMHQYKGLAFFDYATAAPYLKIDMNPVDRLKSKDAVFFSTHKFIGGPQTPGILVAKKTLFKNEVPSITGGGTVFFVSSEKHQYLQDVEHREEGGTPAIVESIRAGMVFQLQKAVGYNTIKNNELKYRKQVLEAWTKNENILILGNPESECLPVFSFLIKHGGRYLHFNYVCALLNDLFGIQCRGGCVCSGPYAQNVLGISQKLAHQYREIMAEDLRLDRHHLRRVHEGCGHEIIRPGVIRLSFNYFMEQSTVDFIIKAVDIIATHGFRLLSHYIFDHDTAAWKHVQHTHTIAKNRKWLGHISYDSGKLVNRDAAVTSEDAPDYEQCLADGMKKLLETKPKTDLIESKNLLAPEVEALRWYSNPDEGKEGVIGNAPFSPKTYPCEITEAEIFKPKLLRTVAAKTTDNTATATTTESAENKETTTTKEEEKEMIDLPACGSRPKVILPTNMSFKKPPKKLSKLMYKAISHFDMIKDGDKIMVCVSGGKDSLSLLHLLKAYQNWAKHKGINFELAAATVDPGTDAYDPSPLKAYMEKLGVPYYYETQGIIKQAENMTDLASICSFCARMKRGILYTTARREGCNVLAFGQHLDDCAESLLMSTFHNGLLRTMKANYTVQEGDLRMIRPLVFIRERLLREFAETANLPVINENCPACFEAPTERARVKQLLAAQELLFPGIFQSMSQAMMPLLEISEVGQENQKRKKVGKKMAYYKPGEGESGKKSDGATTAADESPLVEQIKRTVEKLENVVVDNAADVEEDNLPNSKRSKQDEQ